MKHHPTFAASGTFVLALLVTLLAACSQPKDQFRFSGHIDGVNQAEIYVYSDDGSIAGVDTIHIAGGDFDYRRTLTRPAVLIILYPNFSQTYVVAEPGAHVKMKGNAARLSEADISGTKENEALTDFRRQIVGKPDGDARLAATQFIRTNKTTLAAYAVFKRYFATAAQPDVAATLSLLADLTAAQPHNAALAGMAGRLREQLALAPGQRLPAFNLRDVDNRPVSAATFAGRPLVVAFAATWSADVEALTGALANIRRAYGSRVGLLVVSLDADAATCRDRLRRDSLAVPAVCDGRAFAGPVARTFAVDRVPGNLVVDAGGRIVARNVDAGLLQQRVAELVR